MRLIDADALEDVLLNHGFCYCNESDYSDGVASGFLLARDDVKEAPTIDAEPIKHGRWVWSEDAPLEEGQIEGDRESFYQCSECGAYDLRLKDCHADYCWSCGAKMEVNDEL